MTSYPIELSVDQLMARAREIAGVDIVDDEIVEPLTILHRAYAQEAQLDAEGAGALTRSLVRLLANRLRMKRDFQAHPEIREQPLKGPLVIMGVARSGTTKLQKVLAASGDFSSHGRSALARPCHCRYFRQSRRKSNQMACG